jgi:hypothetical protein
VQHPVGGTRYMMMTATSATPNNNAGRPSGSDNAKVRDRAAIRCCGR